MPKGVLKYRLHRRLYRDSVALMSIASDLEAIDGVIQAGAVMATPANHDILARSQMLPEDLAAEPDDLLVVVRAESADTAEAALDQADAQLTAKVKPAEGGSLAYADKTVAEALDNGPAELVTISVPGVYAGAVAENALRHDCHVFCFSDNVSIEDENRLKTLAAERELLLMGPDCGTAIIDGTPLGFANEIPTGPVAMIAASGTGAQEVSTLAASVGVGMAHIIGVGGRDLAGQIDHPATFVALDKLDAEDSVEMIVVVSKPPAHQVAEALIDRLASLSKPAIACLLGEEDSEQPIIIRGTLEGAAHAIADHFGKHLDTTGPKLDLPKRPGRIHGLYTGGTLAHEAHILCDRASVANQILDLGDDEYTQGRPHPMISPDLRAQMIEKIGEDPDVSVLLVDVVIGWGSSPDPATPVAEAVRAARQRAQADGRTLDVFASITGVDGDHQGLEAQRQILRDASIVVFPSNAAAVRAAIALTSTEE